MTRSPGFPDHFSTAAPAYARFRPRYPAALFAWLADLYPPPARAFDCATGSGQAAVALAARGYQVVASDASVEQLRQARAHPRVTYLAAAAERLPLRDRSVGAVTVAQALHWFDIEVFFREVQRILMEGGIVAVWTYGDLRLGPPFDDAIAPVLARLQPYWPPERALVAAEYRTILFPFRELAAPALTMEHRWTLDALLGYASTWSAARPYRAAGGDVVAELRDALAPLWPAGATLPVRWPLWVRIGRHV